MDEAKKWKIKEVPRWIGRTIKSINEGKLLMRMDIGRYFVHILYCFILIAAAIWISLEIDTTMHDVQENKKVIAQQEAVITIRTYELEAQEARANVTKKLHQMGSPVAPAEKPFISATNNPLNVTTQAPTQAPNQAATQAATQVTTQAPTQAPTKSTRIR